MLTIMTAYAGSARWRCPDCGERLTVPYDYATHGTSPTAQPAWVLDEWQRIVAEHAGAMPLLHPSLLPLWHATGRRARR